MSIDPGTWLQAAAALAVVLLLIWGASRALRATPLAGRGPARGGTRRLSVEETLALDPRRRLRLLRCDGRELLLLTGTGGEDRMLGWLPGQAAGDAP